MTVSVADAALASLREARAALEPCIYCNNIRSACDGRVDVFGMRCCGLCSHPLRYVPPREDRPCLPT